MKSDEEKFLGFFRLLEKLAYKTQSYVDENELKNLLKEHRVYLKNRLGCETKVIKDLSSRVEGANRMKYNTLKCLLDFYDSIPKEITDTFYLKRDDMDKIIKLRNDITHANHYSIENRELYQYTKLINILLFLAFIKELGIPFSVCIPITTNLNRM
jgi:hypothetical protein